MNPSPHPFTSAHVRAVIVKILLIVNAVVAGLILLVDALTLVFPLPIPGQEPGENPMGIVLAILMFLLGVFEIIVYLTTVVFFCMWLYRSYNNLRAFDQWSRLDSSAGWAVGSFFIPFVNLVVPYRAVREVWQNSWPPEEARLSAPDPPASFPLWWMFWLLAAFAGQISWRVTFTEGVPANTAALISIGAGALSILAAVFAFLVVNAIDKRQEETSRSIKLPQFTGPPPPPDLSMSGAVAPAP